MADIFVVFGPPGTGKTQYLAEQARRAAGVYGADRIMIASLTKTAAVEIRARVDLPQANVGTLHSHCYRLLDRPKLATSPNLVKQWNAAFPTWALSRVHADAEKISKADDPLDSQDEGDGSGDALMAEIDVFRHRNRPIFLWNQTQRAFFAKWTEFKRDTGSIDFTDMIEHVAERRLPPVGDAAVLIVDEAQDLSPIENEVVRIWSEHVNVAVVAGDADQWLYDWRGAVPELFFPGAIPVEHTRVLHESHRVPVAAHSRAQSLIRQCGKRVDLEYRPTKIKGHVSPGLPFATPDGLVGRAARHAKDRSNGDLMMIAPCGFTLNPLIKQLRENGIPFHNPFRITNGRFNPLARRKGTSTVDRLLSFVKLSRTGEAWNDQEFKSWADGLLADRVFVRGTKKAMGEPGWRRPETVEELSAILREPGEIERIISGDLQWYFDHAGSQIKTRLEYPMRVAQKFGFHALEETPKVIVGTIHCSPPDERVLTNRGWIRMDELNPDIHRLAGYNRGCNRMTWGSRLGDEVGRGQKFVLAKNPYEGNLVVIETEKSRTRVTPEHRVLARFTERFFDKWVVYLMRRGNWWRVGVCVSAHKPYRSGGVPGRLATEQGDAGWILNICETRSEALVYEELVKARFGIPGLTFESAKVRTLSREQLHLIHESASGAVEKRAQALLDEHGLLVDAPLYRRNGDRKQNVIGYTILTAAANLIDGYMEVPIAPNGFIEGASPPNGKSYFAPDMSEARISREDYDGPVYSLEVPPYHFYASGGMIVHNSVKGGQADSVAISPDMSPKGMEGWAVNPDAIRRLFYVALTRTKNELILCQPSRPRWSVAFW